MRAQGNRLPARPFHRACNHTKVGRHYKQHLELIP